MRKGFWFAVGGVSVALTACGNGGVEENPAAGGADQPLAMITSDGAVGGEATSAEGGTASDTAAGGAADEEVPLVAGRADLTAYVGKFQFDEVGGVAWKDHPLVQAGIRKTVTDAAIRAAISTPDGPSAPIATYQGKVGSWGCQAHNCGDHQWAVLVDPASGATDVCYHDAAKTGENSRWFLADGRQETRPGNCSVV